MKNWKTTLGGVLYFGGTVIGTLLPHYAVFGQAAQAAAVLWLGYHATDKVLGQ